MKYIEQSKFSQTIVSFRYILPFEKETITGKEFMEIFHKVEGIDPDAPKKEEARIGMNPVVGENFVMKPAEEIPDEKKTIDESAEEKQE